MIRSLRKGKINIECWHNYGSDTIQINNTEIELFTNYAVFRTSLKPAGGNQKIDADNIFNNNNYSVNKFTIEDGQIRKLTGVFLRAYESKIESLKFDIVYENIPYTFNVQIEPDGDIGISLQIEK